LALFPLLAFDPLGSLSPLDSLGPLYRWHFASLALVIPLSLSSL
jgi:hypothetical protein